MKKGNSVLHAIFWNIRYFLNDSIDSTCSRINSVELSKLSARHENTILCADFNVSVEGPYMESLCGSYKFNGFWNCGVIEPGLSDFLKW